MKDVRALAQVSYKRQLRKKTEELKEDLVKNIERNVLHARIACICWCAGYMEAAGYDFVPSSSIDFINEQYYAGNLSE